MGYAMIEIQRRVSFDHCSALGYATIMPEDPCPGYGGITYLRAEIGGILTGGGANGFNPGADKREEWPG
jgi:hypothetical protein